MHIAIEGCSHGELDVIYNSIQRLEEIHKFKIDLLLCCGDFQAVRNEKDLKCMAVPLKYMQMQDFHRYYSGEKKAPVLTIFIGGNHEASNYLQELPYGGWVAPNIYYLGYAAVVRFGGLRIGGMSGIYKGPDYLKGHYEKPPYTPTSVRSVYHIRNLDVYRLKQLSNDIDIFMSHDWPRGIYNHGNVEDILQYKEHFRSEIKDNTLGSKPAEELIKKLKPKYWFSGHLHVKFSALMKHKESNGEKETSTKFLALDKCLPRREFLQILQIPTCESEPYSLCYDNEWLTILRLTNHLLSTSWKTVYMPGPGASERYMFTPTPEELEKTLSLMGGSLDIPDSFVKTAEAFCEASGLPDMSFVSMPDPVLNPQTTSLCQKLSIDDPIVRLQGGEDFLSSPSQFSESFYSSPMNQSEMNITSNTPQKFSTITSHPEEIDVSDDGEFELSKDDETGDFVMEVPLVPRHESSGDFQGNQSPLSNPISLKDQSDGVKRQKLSLSTPVSFCQDESSLGENQETALTSSPVASSREPPRSSQLPCPLQNEEEPNSNIGIEDLSMSTVPMKGKEDDNSLEASQSPQLDDNTQHKVKKFKRRNASLYASVNSE